MTSNKVILEAVLRLNEVSESKRKELASKLELPENKQADLMFMSAILVSTGTNKNGATFLGSELIKAKDSIIQKALDIEHEEDKIIGHITSCLFMDYDGNPLDEEELYQSLMSEDASVARSAVENLDQSDMDIGIVCAVYKDRFPKLAEEIELGLWKVSMECYYDSYDLKIGNLIIPKDKIGSLASNMLNEEVNLVIAGKQAGNKRVSRVLRGIRFAGCGIVKNPAEDRAIVLEAANYIRKTIDREAAASDSLVLEAASTVVLNSINEATKSRLSEDSREHEVVQKKKEGYAVFKLDLNSGEYFIMSTEPSYEVAVRQCVLLSSTNQESGVKYLVTKLDSEFFSRSETGTCNTNCNIYKVNKESYSIESITSISDKEAGGVAYTFGPEQDSTSQCISFRKFVYESPVVNGKTKLIATNWCKAFEKPCPVVGADAQHSSCLRNKYSRLTKQNTILPVTPVDAPFNPTVLDGTVTLSSDDLPKPTRSEPEPVPAPKPPRFDSAGDLALAELNTIETQKLLSNLEGSKQMAEFRKRLALISMAERKALSDSEFAIPSTREYPIHTKQLLKNTIDNYNEICKSIASFSKRKEMFSKLVKSGTLQGVDLTALEASAEFSVGSIKGLSDTFGVPRLELFPLDSREQVLAAISRFGMLKADISDSERDNLVVNILRAAKKFDIDTTRFMERVLNRSNK